MKLTLGVSIQEVLDVRGQASTSVSFSDVEKAFVEYYSDGAEHELVLEDGRRVMYTVVYIQVRP